MKMAKASDNDFMAVVDFFNALEEMIEHGCLTSSDGEDTVDVDDAGIVEQIRKAWDAYPGVGSAWRRVVMGYDTLLRNAADPDSDTLEWRKDLEPLVTSLESSGAVGLVAAERVRQISEEGWDSKHDSEHDLGQLAAAAACYALGRRIWTGALEGPDRFTEGGRVIRDPSCLWPFDDCWWKPGDRIRDLVKAGALICAEIDRLTRLKDEATDPVPALEEDVISQDKIDGHLLVGVNDRREVVVNLDKDRTGHIVFSPNQARHLAALLTRKAADCDAKIYGDSEKRDAGPLEHWMDHLTHDVEASEWEHENAYGWVETPDGNISLSLLTRDPCLADPQSVAWRKATVWQICNRYEDKARVCFPVSYAVEG